MKSSAALAPALCESARIVARVAAGKSLSGQLNPLTDGADATLRGALIDITHGTLRRYGRVQAIVRELSLRGRPDALVEALLWCSLYALESGRYAEYTAVDQAVRACALLEKWTAKGYVNALLRGFLRQRKSLEARVRTDVQARYQHPHWWIDLLSLAYPDRWQDILAAGNSRPPMALRVNRRRACADEYAKRLAASGLLARSLDDNALLLDQAMPVERLPGFAAGEVSVQDAGAQRAAKCLQLASGQRVLDACAAPGGKTAHILEAADVDLTALDADPERCRRVVHNLERLGLAASVVAADCTRLGDWWNGMAFDRILADVPCSASGVVRRHPDLKWLRRAQDIPAFAARQATILDALWQVLAPDGKLLYVTCSVFPGENEAVVSAFVARTPGARRMSEPDGAGAQWLPAPEHDGFFYALIAKQP
jgi:16S rRNA (cytosine967-C5)-methyltransferase